jgi:hypothetical protein
MRIQAKIAVAGAALVAGATPALALASHGNSGSAPGHDHTTGTQTTGTTPTTPAQAHGYGVLCQKESKKHVAGTPGTPFSACVKAMAKIDNGSATNPTSACRKLSKKHVKGTPGTPFSNCVKAAAKLLAEKHAADGGTPTTSTSTTATGSTTPQG